MLTLARDLRRRRARERQGLFVAEGVRAVDELLRSDIAVRGVLVSPQLAASARGALEGAAGVRGVTLAEVTAEEFASAADTESPQGVLAIGEVPDRSTRDLSLPETARLVVLDGVQDPGNVGTILRTAAAFGVAATLALPGTVDLWNAKVVRSAMGALFHHPVLSCTWEELATFLAAANAELWGADAGGEPVARSRGGRPSRLALAVGNEGAGLSREATALASRLVGLPIASHVESLNVAVATGILLYELQP
ncbi:MAG TPA: RNA methyltransferase [Gemmatimonadaceae bacterium]|nr:RNA methyltransferase [Gemmatimonadaceae bacterium]